MREGERRYDEISERRKGVGGGRTRPLSREREREGEREIEGCGEEACSRSA